MEYLFSVWEKIALQLCNAKHILLLSDFDGTITPIVERPEMALLPEYTRHLLEIIAKNNKFTIGVISGRALTDLKNRINLKNIVYAGNHGLEIEGPGISFVQPFADEIKPILRVINHILSKGLKTIKGAFVEDKELSLSVHYRQVDESQSDDLKVIFNHITNRFQVLNKIKITHGKKVFEVRPAINWDKGKAIKLIMKKYSKGGRMSGWLPIYIGDDLTDEDGFKVIERYGNGISIFVGTEKNNTSAKYYLDTPDQVTKFLELLIKQNNEGLVWVPQLTG